MGKVYSVDMINKVIINVLERTEWGDMRFNYTVQYVAQSYI